MFHDRNGRLGPGHAATLAAATTLMVLAGCVDPSRPTVPSATVPGSMIPRPHSSVAVTGADYTFTGLTNVGSTIGYATAVNDLGHAAGAEYGVLSNNQGYTEYFWGQPSVATAVIPCCGQVGGINDYDEVVGFGTHGSAGGAAEAYLWTPSLSAALYIGTSNGVAISYGNSVNDAGAIVGRGGPDYVNQHALLWQPASVRGTSFTLVDLGTLPGDATSQANFVNAAGQIVGQSFDAAGNSHAVLWQPTFPGATTYTAINIGTLGGALAEAWQINASGQIIGNSSASDGSRHAFVWTPATANGTNGIMTDLGPGGAGGISDNGIVVGNNASNQGWIWTAVSGQSMLPVYGTQVFAFTISRGGTIGGKYYDAGGNQYPMIWQLNNLPPVANAGPAQTAFEGSAVTFDGSGSSDPDGDALTYQWSFSDGGSTTGAKVQHTFVDDGTYTATLTVTDAHGATNSTTTPVSIANVAPTLDPFTPSPLGPVPVGTSIAVPGTFHDPGVLDTHTAEVNWDDGSGLQAAAPFGSITEDHTNGGGSLSLTRTYTQAGVYSIQLQIADNGGGQSALVTAGTGSGTQFVSQYVVVYDPSAGFVTGGGWINSPSGAYTADPTLTGKATFGFVAKYQAGANTPSGHTEFDFHVANLTFQSTSYQWLVVSGARAQYKGAGTINGAGSYNFILTAVDGDLLGGGQPDQFRIKITDSAGNIVYDNMLGASDTATLDPSTALGGGSITIHS